MEITKFDLVDKATEAWKNREEANIRDSRIEMCDMKRDEKATV